MRTVLLRALALTSALGLSTGCSSWQLVEHYDGWSLYERSAAPVVPEDWRAAFEPALVAVEAVLGPVPETVRVHAWLGAVGMEGRGRSVIHGPSEAGIQDVPGIGPARIQAWHSRTRGKGSGGIFISEPDPGTAAHELVHALMAARRIDVPLWFEEGLATLIGDGAMLEGRWIIDGLAAWPLRELREEALGDAELRRLLAVEPGEAASVRENVLVHFIGWAIVFDLYRETGKIDLDDWMARIDFQDPVPGARVRLARSIAPSTPREWLARLRDDDPGVRLATARGMWKVRDDFAFEALLDALEVEQHPEVQAALAINLLAGGSEVRVPPRTWRRLVRSVRPVLTSPKVKDPAEAAALVLLSESLGNQRPLEDVAAALDVLARYWRE